MFKVGDKVTAKVTNNRLAYGQEYTVEEYLPGFNQIGPQVKLAGMTVYVQAEHLRPVFKNLYCIGFDREFAFPYSVVKFDDLNNFRDIIRNRNLFETHAEAVAFITSNNGVVFCDDSQEVVK